MSDQEETMRIVAEIVDKFSKPLSEMRKDLKDTTSRRADPRLQQSFEGAGRAVRDLRNSIKGGLTSALAEFGVGALSIAGAVSVLKNSILGFTQSTVALSHLNRETGVSINYLRQLEAVGGRVGVMPETMRSGMSAFARNMQELRAGTGNTLNTLLEKGDLNVRKFALSLRSVGSNEEALKKTLEVLGRIPRVIDRERLLEAFGLPAQLGLMNGKERARAFREAADDIGMSSRKAQEAAERFDKSLWRLGNAWQGLELQVGESGALDSVRDVVTELRNFVQHDSAAITDGIKDIAGAVEFLGGTLIESLKGWHELKKIYGDLKQLGPPPAVVGPSRGLDAHKFDSPYNMDFLIDPDWWKQNTKKMWGDDTKTNPPTGIIPPKGMFLGPSWQTQESLKKGTKEGTSEGVVEGFKKMMLEMTPNGKVPVTRANYEGTAGMPPRHDRMASNPSTFDMKPSLGGGNAFLREQRAGITKEIANNPGLREELGGMMLLEGTPRESMESLANRYVATNEWRKQHGKGPLSLRQMLHGGFYGPINRGQLPGAIARLRRDKTLRDRMNSAIDGVLGGSNDLRGATDQGMPSDPNGQWAGGGFRLRKGGNVFNDWGGGGGHEFNRRWREQQQNAVERSQREAERRRLEEQRQQSRNRLMEGVVKTGFGGAQKVEGDATVRIDLNGFPRGTRTDYDASGMFKTIELNRGRIAPLADS